MESRLNGQQDNENKRIVFVISVLVVNVLVVSVSVVSFRTRINRLQNSAQQTFFWSLQIGSIHQTIVKMVTLCNCKLKNIFSDSTLFICCFSSFLSFCFRHDFLSFDFFRSMTFNTFQSKKGFFTSGAFFIEFVLTPFWSPPNQSNVCC